MDYIIFHIRKHEVLTVLNIHSSNDATGSEEIPDCLSNVIPAIGLLSTITRDSIFYFRVPPLITEEHNSMRRNNCIKCKNNLITAM